MHKVYILKIIFFLVFLPGISANAHSVEKSIDFIENKGQWERNVFFRAEIPGGQMYIHDEGFLYDFAHMEDVNKWHDHAQSDINAPVRHHAYKVKFRNAVYSGVVRKSDQRLYYHNYFIGSDPARWAGRVHLYGGIEFSGIYKNIDLKIYGSGAHSVKYDFIVHPGADPQQIELSFEGVTPVLTKDGKLGITTSVNEIWENAPYTYQLIKGKRVPVVSHYVLEGSTVRFAFPDGYDTTQALIIDPDLIFASYSGSGGSGAHAHSTAYDTSGNVYTAARASAGWPVTIGAYQTAYPGSHCIGISKISKDGTTLLYSTFFGGTGSRPIHPHTIRVNGHNELVMAGGTTDNTTPVTGGAYQSVMSGASDIYVARFSEDGTALLASTFIGGSGEEALLMGTGSSTNSLGANNELNPADITFDAEDNVWVTANTRSGDFPVTANAYRSTLAGSNDAVIFKMTPDLTALTYSTYIGGAGWDGGIGIEYSASQDAIGVVGYTESTNFPVTAHAYKPTRPGRKDGFALLIKNSSYQVLATTYLGTSEDDIAIRIAFDCSGHVYVAGTTRGNYPVTATGSHITNGYVFIDKLSPDLSSSLASVRTGAAIASVIPSAMMVDVCGNVLVATFANSTAQQGMPLTSDAFLSVSRPLYFAGFSPNFDSLIFGSYMGTNADHTHPGVYRMDPDGVIYHSVCSNVANWPVTSNAYAPAKTNTSFDNITFKFDFDIVPKLFVTHTSGGGVGVTETHCVRGCKSAFLHFNSDRKPDPVLVKFQIEGDAVNGVDYQWISDSVVIAPNQTSAALEIKPLTVSGTSVPNPKHVIINTYALCGCEQIISRDTVWIYDSLYARIITPPDTICPGDEILIEGEIVPGTPFVWSPENLIDSPSSLSVRISPVKNTTVSLTVFQPGAPVTCPPRTASYTVVVEQYPKIRVPEDIVLCPLEDSLAITVRPQSSNVGYRYKWLTADHLKNDHDSANMFFAPSGQYNMIVSASSLAAGCETKDSFNITILPPFEFDWVSPADTTIQLGDSIQLDSGGDAVAWSWFPPRFLDFPDVKRPWSRPSAPITYILTGKNHHGCTGTAEVKINLTYQSITGIPTAFSPNGDGLNDVFRIVNVKYERLLSFVVFNRYGQVVFETNDARSGWDGTVDGKPTEIGTYFYHIVVSMPLDGGEKVFKGDVTLVR